MAGELDLAMKGDPFQGHGEEVKIPVSAYGGCLANDVGNESEPSFNRAFKWEFGVQPARFRSQTRRAPGKK